MHYFIKFTSEGAWQGAWPHANDDVSILRGKYPDFKSHIRMMLFGKEGCKIWVFDHGFVHALEGEASSDGHPLKKVGYNFHSVPICHAKNGWRADTRSIW